MDQPNFKKIGLAAFLLRYPKTRHFLGRLMDTGAFADTLEAYGEATSFRDRLRSRPDAEASLLDEYEQLCDAIETDVWSMVKLWRDRVS